MSRRTFDLSFPDTYEPWATVSVLETQVAAWDREHQPADYYHYWDDPEYHALLVVRAVVNAFEEAYQAATDEGVPAREEVEGLLDLALIAAVQDTIYRDHMQNSLLHAARIIRRWIGANVS